MDFKTLSKTKLKSNHTYYTRSRVINNEDLIINKNINNKGVITIQGKGETNIEGTSKITINANNIVISGFLFTNIQGAITITINGNNNQFCNNEISNASSKIFMIINGDNNRIHKNTFMSIDKDNDLIVCRGNGNLIDNNTFNRNTLNYVIAINSVKGKYIQKGRNVIYNNFISDCNCKMGVILLNGDDNKVLYNKITRCEHSAMIISSKKNKIKYNIISGDLSNKPYGGIFIKQNSNIISNNLFDTLTTIEHNLSPISVMSKIQHLQITNNQFIECYYCLSIGIKRNNKDKKKVFDYVFKNNQFSKCRGVFNNNNNNNGFDTDKGIDKDNEVYKKDIELNIYKPNKLDKININDFINSLFKEDDKKKIKKDKPIEVLEIIDEPIEEIKTNTKTEDLGLDKFFNIMDKIKQFKTELIRLKELRDKENELINEMIKLFN